MQHLSKSGLSHTRLDSSRVLFAPDGSAKIGRLLDAKTGHLLNRSAHFNECQRSESDSARSLAIIAVQMMENDTAPDRDGKIALKHPAEWSTKASHFVHTASAGTLKDLEKVGDISTLRLGA